MAKRPYEDTELAKFVDRRVLELRNKKTQIKIATEAGFVSPNMMSMVKNGASKLPIDRVPSLAKALECDPALLLRMALEQEVGSTATAALFQIMSKPVTENEQAWLETIRDASDHSNPSLSRRGRALIRALFGKVDGQ